MILCLRGRGTTNGQSVVDVFDYGTLTFRHYPPENVKDFRGIAFRDERRTVFRIIYTRTYICVQITYYIYIYIYVSIRTLYVYVYIRVFDRTTFRRIERNDAERIVYAARSATRVLCIIYYYTRDRDGCVLRPVSARRLGSRADVNCVPNGCRTCRAGVL